MDEQQKPQRKKGRKQQFPVPEGGFKSHVIPDFDHKKHIHPRESAFSDPLDFLKFKRDIKQKELEELNNRVKEMEQIGALTPEKRKQLEERRRILAFFEKYPDELKIFLHILNRNKYLPHYAAGRAA